MKYLISILWFDSFNWFHFNAPMHSIIIKFSYLLQHWDGEALRAFLLSTHYRHPISFAESAVADADRRVEYFYETLAKADGYLAQKKYLSGEPRMVDEHAQAFRDALEDDLNTAEAMARVERVYGLLNARIDAKAPPDEVAALLYTARTLSQVLGLAPRTPQDAIRERRTLAASRKGIDPHWVEERIAARIAARKAKDFAKADAIRAEVAGKGVEMRDGPSGTDWRVLPG